MERRLAATMSADVVGYSRLIRADKEGTIAALKALRAGLIDPKLAEHHGRIVKLMGDGMLAEFPSVVDAVRAAVETQQAVAEHNTDLPEEERIEFRIGINLGDVIIDGDDIQGDGVNVAAQKRNNACLTLFHWDYFFRSWYKSRTADVAARAERVSGVTELLSQTVPLLITSTAPTGRPLIWKI